MATYEYRCDQHGRADVSAPLGHAPASWPCPVCTHDSPRVFSSVPLAVRGSYARAIESAERSRAEPSIVTRLPETAHWRGSRDVKFGPPVQRLPRP